MTTTRMTKRTRRKRTKRFFASIILIQNTNSREERRQYSHTDRRGAQSFSAEKVSYPNNAPVSQCVLRLS
jgi:hypothetical protein